MHKAKGNISTISIKNWTVGNDLHTSPRRGCELRWGGDYNICIAAVNTSTSTKVLGKASTGTHHCFRIILTCVLLAFTIQLCRVLSRFGFKTKFLVLHA